MRIPYEYLKPQLKILNEFFWFILATIFHKNNRGRRESVNVRMSWPLLDFLKIIFFRLLWSRGDDVKDRECAS